MQATHFRIAAGVEAGLTNSAVSPLSADASGLGKSKAVVSAATGDGPLVAEEVGALRFPVSRFVESRAVWKGFRIIFFFMFIVLIVADNLYQGMPPGCLLLFQ